MQDVEMPTFQGGNVLHQRVLLLGLWQDFDLFLHALEGLLHNAFNVDQQYLTVFDGDIAVSAYPHADRGHRDIEKGRNAFLLDIEEFEELYELSSRREGYRIKTRVHIDLCFVTWDTKGKYPEKVNHTISIRFTK